MESFQINRIIDELTKKSGLAHDQFIHYNGQINYRSLYQYGMILTDLLQKKHKEEGTREPIDEDDLNPVELETAKKYFEKTFADINKKLDNKDRAILIKLKYLFEMVDKYRSLNTVNVKNALWGIAISLADFFIDEDIQKDDIIKYKEQLIEARPFVDVEGFDQIWMKGIGIIINHNLKNFEPDYRALAGYLRKESREYKDFQTLCLGIDVIGNTNIHAARCPRALHGAMITSIENFGDSDNKTKILHDLGKNAKKEIKKNKEKNSNDTGRANRRIPRWARHPEQINSTIVWSFFQAEAETGKVTKSQMRQLCKQRGLSEQLFNSNYACMITDAGNAHGKVFEDDGENVWIWKEVESTLLQYKSYFYKG